MVEIAELKEPVAVSKPSSIVGMFGLDDLLSTGLKTELFAIERQIRSLDGNNEGFVYELSCKIFSDIRMQGKSVPDGVTYSSIQDFYRS
jgi:hypothetical protein